MTTKNIRKKKNKMMRNFTAILPVTCNASCSFCPEKEMEKKAGQREWLNNLIEQINKHEGTFDHVSLSGGEATLRMNYLFEVMDEIREATNIKNIGLTSNGRFLNKQEDILRFLNGNTTEDLQSKLHHLNISMHSFDPDLNNDIMGTEYTYTHADLVRFRRLIGKQVSFHINFVINPQNIDNIEWEMQQARLFMEANPYIDVVFRVDYNLPHIAKQIREEYEEEDLGSEDDVMSDGDNLLSLFLAHFYVDRPEEDDDADPQPDMCASCFSLPSNWINHNRAWLKASSYEPNEDEGEYTEYVFHMDGKLYYDWSRNDPVTSVKNVQREKPAKAKAAKKPKLKKFDFDIVDAPAEKPEKPVREKRARVVRESDEDESCRFHFSGSSCRF